MLTIISDTLVAQRGARTIALQRVTQQDKYRALMLLGTRPAVAQALMAGLVTIKGARQ